MTKFLPENIRPSSIEMATSASSGVPKNTFEIEESRDNSCESRTYTVTVGPCNKLFLDCSAASLIWFGHVETWQNCDSRKSGGTTNLKSTKVSCRVKESHGLPALLTHLRHAVLVLVVHDHLRDAAELGAVFAQPRGGLQDAGGVLVEILGVEDVPQHHDLERDEVG